MCSLEPFQTSGTYGLHQNNKKSPANIGPKVVSFVYKAKFDISMDFHVVDAFNKAYTHKY